MSPAALDYSDWTGLLADTPRAEVCSTPPRARKLTGCDMCHRHVPELPTYADRR